MAKDFGTGVSRTLDAAMRQFTAVVFQDSKPPLDAEFNLQDDIHTENLSKLIRAEMPSGFFIDPTRAIQDYLFDPNWSNYFILGNPRTVKGSLDGPEKMPIVWANINGWVIPVLGTDISTEGDLTNLIKLYPPPESDSRIDYVFLEAWQCRVDPNPSEINKPAADKLWKYGNVKYGGTNLTDDLEDPAIGFATTGRIQVQYRLRVYGRGVGLGASVNLDIYPDGLGDPNILGQATAALPVGGFYYTNMREDLSDPSLWRAGNGNPNNDLGTVDGYTYAIPVCAIFRRNSNVYVAVAQSGNPNQNGGFNRLPGTKYLPDPLTGDKALTTATLTNLLLATDGADPSGADAVVDVTNLNGSGLEDSRHVLSSTFLVINDEILGLSEVDLVNNTITIPAGDRGRYATAAAGHQAGTTIYFYNSRPDGMYSDQIADTDVLDLRRGVNANDWDFGRLLQHNIGVLAKGTLRTAWKKAGAGDTQGVVAHEVDYLYADGSTDVPNHTEALDGPDGIRTVWSDAATYEPDVTLLLDNNAAQDAGTVGFTSATFDATVEWDVGPDFHPSGFMNVAGLAANDVFTNGSSIFLFLGGDDGTRGARGTFRDGSTRAVRAIMPDEFWKTSYPTVAPDSGNQYPVTVRFINQRAHEPAPADLDPTLSERHPGPMYSWREADFEKPFIVLGGLLRTDLRITGIPVSALSSAGSVHEIDVGLDFDAAGAYYEKDANGNFLNDPDQITQPLLRDSRTLYGMLTGDGRDSTGVSSEVYLVLYGDDSDRNNNGVFKVIGAGQTTGYTTYNASNSTSLVVSPLSQDFSAFNPVTGKTLTVEWRSQEHNADDTSTHDASVADFVIGLTDIGGFATGPQNAYPWQAVTLGSGEAYDNSMPVDSGDPTVAAIPAKMVIGMALMYHPGRSGMARVPDDIVRFAMKGGVSETLGAYLRQAPATVDTTFSSVSGAPDNEAFWDPIHAQLWNRLPGCGWFAPDAPSYGGDIVGFTESDREHELFHDRGSKTFIFRPFRDREMTLQAMTFPIVAVPVDKCLIGDYTYPSTVAKDGLLLFTHTTGQESTSGKRMGFVMPREFMPRFGRQDIPYWKDINAGAGPFLPGINHLFRDSSTLTAPVFNIIGGETNHGTPEVNPLFFTTNDPSHYGAAGTIIDATNNRPHYKARKTTDIDPVCADAPEVIEALRAVNSSDLGKGLKGIQLPPYLGIARLYGVYDARDFETKGGRTFKANRYQMDDDPAPNLIREDADEQTLYILQDGAKDLTHEDADHTYIIPSNVLDITRAIQYQEGDAFEDYNYVVELTAFGFSKGFINLNNFVLVRRYNGGGGENTDGTDPQLEGIHQVIPCPAGYNDQLYGAYNRTVYQGDPYMTRQGDTTMESDYEHRYGQLSIGAQYQLRTPIQQFDADGNFVPQTPNARTFEVLAAMDFYTTLGTGKVGGDLFAGTPLDIGFTQNTPDAAYRAPDSNDSRTWRILPRTFTEGQKTSTNRARASVEILDNDNMIRANTSADAFALRFGLLDGTAVTLYGMTTTFKPTLQPVLGVPDEDIFIVDTTGESHDVVFHAVADFGTLRPEWPDMVKQVTLDSGTYPELAGVGSYTQSINVTAPDSVEGLKGGVVFDAFVSGLNEITVRAVYTANPVPFEAFPEASGHNVRIHTWDIPSVAPGATVTEFVAWSGAATASTEDTVVVISHTNNIAAQLIITAHAAASSLRIVAFNPTAAPIDPPSVDFRIAVLKDLVMTDWQLAVAKTLTIHITRGDGSKDFTANNLVGIINAHSKLQQSVKAFNDGTPKITVEATPTGVEGNGLRIESLLVNITNPPSGLSLSDTLKLATTYPNTWPVGAPVTGINFANGEDLLLNAGDGTSQLDLTGMIERLPLGAALQDSDFLCENPLGDDASAMQTCAVGPRPIQTLMPLTTGGEEFERFLGEPGSLLALSDGSVSVLNFGAWTSQTPTGSRIYRIFRGGGPTYVMSGDNPGGPIDWVSETFPPSSTPVLKGGVLVCRALLVRNFYEEANPAGGPTKTTDGDEIQMVLITHGILGNGSTQQDGVTLDGIISPSGYGEGFASSERYRIDGRPMFRGFNRETPNAATVQLAVFPEGQREIPTTSGGTCP